MAEDEGLCCGRDDLAGDEATVGDQPGCQGKGEEGENLHIEGRADVAIGAVWPDLYASCGITEGRENRDRR